VISISSLAEAPCKPQTSN